MMTRLICLLCTVVLVSCYPLKNNEIKNPSLETITSEPPIIYKRPPIKPLSQPSITAEAAPPKMPTKYELQQGLGPKRFIAPTFYPVTHPYQKIRNDNWGDGFFRASRGRRVHNGLDIIVIPHTAVYSPIEGIVTRKAYPYGETGRNKKWEGIVIQGVNAYKGYEVKIFYMIPFLIGERVYPNTVIGKAQAISEKYSSVMIDHLHVEVRFYGQLQDPAHLFNLIK